MGNFFNSSFLNFTYLYSENLPTKGMLISQTSTTGKKEYSYDQYLRLNEVTEAVLTDGKSFTFGYQYDL
ncbi:MAG: hypothetical protein LBQ22_10805, partial [Bacteroidales bacterium]|nr:hypothetical protein [Bacteroidales bacterium]